MTSSGSHLEAGGRLCAGHRLRRWRRKYLQRRVVCALGHVLMLDRASPLLAGRAASQALAASTPHLHSTLFDGKPASCNLSVLSLFGCKARLSGLLRCALRMCSAFISHEVGGTVRRVLAMMRAAGAEAQPLWMASMSTLQWRFPFPLKNTWPNSPGPLPASAAGSSCPPHWQVSAHLTRAGCLFRQLAKVP